MKASSISSADLDAIREDLLQTVWSATLPFQQELLSCGGVTFMGLRNAVTDAILSGPIASEIARLTGENARLDHNCQEWVRQAAENAEAADRLARRAEAAEAETARLRAALEEIAKGAPETEPHPWDGELDTICWNIAKIARAALTSQEQADA